MSPVFARKSAGESSPDVPTVSWEEEAKRVLRAELARAGATYKSLARDLERIGVADNEAAIASRISRGKFSFVFFLQCMRALGISEVDLRERRTR